MDTDKKGKASKQECMKLLEVAFERLDRDKNGELDLKKLAHESSTATHLVVK